ncbi:alpha-L-fucosidase [Porphyromonas sp.]|uniref:alpha-L-fucosidase n=1 Tax=Porphyromonas sp. TaxID=1924944 RepID=UPI0026DDBBB8|nr:alpha-L-fucosidase [Porphyromonas sp.]MDO4695607.1 alpha-L-fucosidase [Porphyromonas sp.]MDO4771553.1 alpha-L-fucosidase [Porphyromonas sp.]
MKRTLLCLLAIILLFPTHSRADWWGDKYSMFVHYGLYSIPAGVFQGKRVEKGYSEQILTFGIGFSDWYEAYAREFTATNFAADTIVALAKRAGMRSVVMTAKHHDGFCLFDTKTTDYNSFDGAPAKRDLIKELSEACHRNGLGFGIYFSLIDWHFPGAMPFSSHNADPITPDHHEYNKAQVSELLSNYGKVDELWFDMGSLLPEQSRELYELVHKLQPDCMVSGRLGNDYADFCVMPDNQFPDYDIILPWQTAASIFPETWGYRSWQERGDLDKKVYEKLKDLLNVVSRGGKYLLNIGPMGDGSIVPFEHDVLMSLGMVLASMSEAVYNTLPSPYNVQSGVPLVTMAKDKKALYLFIERERSDIFLPDLNTPIKELSILNAKGKAASVITQDGCKLSLNIEGERPYFTVIKVVFETPVTIKKPVANERVLSPHNALNLYAQSAVDYYSGFRSILGYEWELPGHNETMAINFTDSELSQNILLNMDGREELVELSPLKSKTVTFDTKKIHWTDLHMSTHRGLFGSVPEIFLRRDLSDVKWERHHMTLNMKEIVKDRTGIYLRYDIEAKESVELPISISYRDGILVYVDGVYFAGDLKRVENKQKNSDRDLLIPLNKGQHTLLFKVYSRWGGELLFSMKVKEKYNLHTMPINEGKKTTVKTLRVSKELVAPLASPSRLCNIRVIRM